jgi:hypothetical protein
MILTLLTDLVKAAPQLESLLLKPAWGSHAPLPNCHPYFINVRAPMSRSNFTLVDVVP